MKTRPMIALVLAITMAPFATARAQDPELQKSIAPFTSAPSPPIDVVNVKFYQALEKPQYYIGYSWALVAWFKGMYRIMPDLRRSQYQLAQDTDFYLELVKTDLGPDVVKRTRATTQPMLDAINESNAALAMVKQYQDSRLNQRKAALAEAQAWNLLNQAIKEVDAESLVIVQADLVKESGDLAKRKAEIMEKAKKAPWIVDALSTARSAVSKVKDFVKDPSHLVEYMVDKTAAAFDEALMNNVLLENWETLKSIDDRMAAIEKSLAGGKRDEMSLRLAAKRDKLAAARLALIRAGIDRYMVDLVAIDVLDGLAALERRGKARGGKCELFAYLQSYAQEARLSAAQMRIAANHYMALLNGGPPGQAPYAVTKIDRDYAYVTTYFKKEMDLTEATGGDPTAWARMASKTGQYMTRQANWYKSENARVQKVVENLDAGMHLQLVDWTMDQVAMKMGSTR